MGGQKSYWYYKLKFSTPGRFYSSIMHPGLQSEHRKTLAYYERILDNGNGLVFDVGANVGILTEVFLELNKHVVVCEPDPENFKVLSARFFKNERVSLVPAAVSDVCGYASAWLSPAHGRCLTTLSRKRFDEMEGKVTDEGTIHFDRVEQVQTITLNNLIETYGVPEYIKIDVEGMEKQVIDSLTIQVPLISFEANLPAFIQETRDIISRLVNLCPAAVFNCSTDDETLIFDDYVHAAEIEDLLDSQSLTYMEIFCKMH